MRCRGCGGDCATVLVMEPMPLAGAFAETREEALASERFPLEWRRCGRCGLVNVWPSVPEERIFAHYSYRASDVPALVAHHAAFAAWLRRFDPVTHVEIGGNDGVLARQLPWEVINVDPSDAWVGPGINEPWSMEVARRIGHADLVTSSNAMAHFDALGEAFEAVAFLLTSEGRFVMEVHDLDATLASKQWDTIYHEHRVEWGVDSLRNVGLMHGLLLESVERLPLHGGLLRATFRRGRRGMGKPEARDFSGLQRAYDEAVAPSLPKGSVAYGAAARATVRLNHTRPDVVAVIDGSPRRYGRYVPGLGLPVVPPSAFGDPPAALITAIGHERDIMAAHPGYERWVTWQ